MKKLFAFLSQFQCTYLDISNLANERTFQAITWLLFSIICFDLMAVHIRYLSITYTPEELSFYRNTLGLIPSILLLYFTAELSFKLQDYKIKLWKLAFFRGFIVALALLLFYRSDLHSNISNSSLQRVCWGLALGSNFYWLLGYSPSDKTRE